MALREEFENTGNWLFRWRSYLPLAVIVIYLLGMREYACLGHSGKSDHLWKAFCLIISFLGLYCPSTVCMNFFPKDPVPPVISMDELFNILIRTHYGELKYFDCFRPYLFNHLNIKFR